MTNQPEESPPTPNPHHIPVSPIFAAAAATAAVLTLVATAAIIYSIGVRHITHGATIATVLTTQAWMLAVAIRLRDRSRADNTATIHRIEDIAREAVATITKHIDEAAEAIAEDRYSVGRTDGQLATIRAIADGHLTTNPAAGKSTNRLRSIPHP